MPSRISGTELWKDWSRLSLTAAQILQTLSAKSIAASQPPLCVKAGQPPYPLWQPITSLAALEANLVILCEMTVRISTLGEQRAIVTVLSDMDAETTALQQHRDKTHAINQGMMQQLLTGRARLI